MAGQEEDPALTSDASGVQRVWGHEPSHSQVNSHVGNWSPERTPESSERDCRGQNPLHWGVLYIIGMLLKRRCLKWARIAHLDIYNASYGQKNGRESKWQFDSWPLKVENQPDFRACKKPATYRWKALDKGYNFASDLIIIEVCTRSYAPSKLRESKVLQFRDSQVPRQKTIWMWPLWRGTKLTIRGKVVASPKSRPWWVLCVRVARG